MGVNLSGLTGWQYNAIYERIPVNEDGQYNILTAGVDNLYYQNAEQLKLGSPLTKSAVEVLTDFLNGSGWEESGDTVVNRFGESITDILNKVAKSAAEWSGAFAIHLNFNGKGAGVEMQNVPIPYCRFKIPTRPDGRVSRIAVSDNWERSTTKRDLEPIDYPLLNPLTAAADTLKAGRGQILYFTGVEDGLYPLATYDSILPTTITDDSIQNFERNQVTRGFHGAAIVHYPAPLSSKEEKAKVKQKVEEVLGVDSPGALVVTVDQETDKPMVEVIPGLENNDIFTVTLLSVRNRVLQVFQMPQSLMGITSESSVFSQNTFFESWTVYNVITRNKRKSISRAVNKVTDLMGFRVGKIVENDLGVIPNFGAPEPIAPTP